MTDLDRIAHALGDPLRQRILDLLAAGRCQDCCSPDNPEVPQGVCACDLGPQLGDMAPSKLAYHLKILRESGLLREQARGKWVYYSINADTLDAFASDVIRRWGTPDTAES